MIPTCFKMRISSISGDKMRRPRAVRTRSISNIMVMQALLLASGRRCQSFLISKKSSCRCKVTSRK